MNFKIIKKSFSLFAINCLLIGNIKAHHSMASYATELSEYTGTIASVEWRNPHIVFTIINSLDNKLWRFEAESIYVLKRAGINDQIIDVGDFVRIAANPSSIKDRDALAKNLLRPDGIEIVLHPTSKPLWSNNFVGIYNRSIENNTNIDTVSENKGFFRTWSNPGTFPKLTAHLPFTDRALQSRKEWDVTNNFATRCEPEGMPRIMRNPHPYEFINLGKTIEIKTELYDTVRIVHMEDVSVTPNIKPSRLGYSTGYWENRDLVVKTSHIDWPYFDNIGTKQSQNVVIEERYTLSNDQNRLYYHFSINDSYTFSEVATFEGYWVALGEILEPYSCSLY
tara:strand:+ start:645 stop:1655 length:1011 start_codon:yes stop_codon:yes gene_type:complete